MINRVEKTLMLQLLDYHWKEHLAALDHLRQGIHLRGYAQKNPAQEYKRESFELFAKMLKRIKYELAATLSKLEISAAQQLLYPESTTSSGLQYHHMDIAVSSNLKKTVTSAQEVGKQPFIRIQRKVGRNEVCYCGSRIKYKQCHGKLN